ncbi:hypothetical protein HanPSC8_Chr13g0544961 [Helianthus annuus]|nr:hypothetical protein HanPSC8_Chr13g0544961 [Helianthus annuus]
MHKSSIYVIKQYTTRSNHQSRRSRRRLSVAPASTPKPTAAACALQPSFGRREKVGKGKLLGGGEGVNTTEPENSSTSAETSHNLLTDEEKTLETTFFGRSFGSGPIISLTDDSVVLIARSTSSRFEFFF